MTARIILALVMLVIAGSYLTWRLIGTGKGQHAAPRGWNADSERLVPLPEQVIESVRVKGRPPWEDVPPDAYVIAAATVSAGQMTSMRVGVIPALPPSPDWAPRPALPAYAEKALKHPTVDEAVESIASRAMFLELDEKLREDAS